MGHLRHHIETQLRVNGWSRFDRSDRKLNALHDAVIRILREVDNLSDEVARLKRENQRAA
jgi:hypothetical protein